MLVALGFITIYSVTGIVNLAQGEYCHARGDAGGDVCALGSAAGAGGLCGGRDVMLIGVLIERLTVHPARSASR